MILRMAALTLAIDQAVKSGLLYGLDLVSHQVIDVIPPLLTLRLGWNTGINFGLFAGYSDAMRWALIVIALIIIAVILRWTWHLPERRVQVASGLLIGGALGNVLDRLVYGAVVDYLNMSCCGITNPFVFNLADMAIFAGAIGLALFMPSDKPSKSV